MEFRVFAGRGAAGYCKLECVVRVIIRGKVGEGRYCVREWMEETAGNARSVVRTCPPLIDVSVSTLNVKPS